MTDLHAFYHCYADGVDWGKATADYVDALNRYGLYDRLSSLHVGFQGTPIAIERAEAWLRLQGLEFDVIARAAEGWEQTTLTPMHEWCKHHDGYVSYAHSKGAGFQRPIQDPWRRGMLYHMIVHWERCVEMLDGGAKVVGCHRMKAAPAARPEWGWSGMFAGNFWWTSAEVLRHNVPPTYRSRLDAEHWLFQLTEVMDLSDRFVVDMNPGDPGDASCHPTVW